MTHRIIVTINEYAWPVTEFECHEPDSAWCRRNLLDPDDPEELAELPEFQREHPTWCWFTVLETGLITFGVGGTYDGPPHTELRSGEVVFTRIKGRNYPADFCTWHYVGDDGGHEFKSPSSRTYDEFRDKWSHER